MAAVLACGPGRCSRTSAPAHLWGLCGSRGPVEVLRRSGGATQGAYGCTRPGCWSLRSDGGGWESRSPRIERALLDLAARLDYEASWSAWLSRPDGAAVSPRMGSDRHPALRSDGCRQAAPALRRIAAGSRPRGAGDTIGHWRSTSSPSVARQISRRQRSTSWSRATSSTSSGPREGDRRNRQLELSTGDQCPPSSATTRPTSTSSPPATTCTAPPTRCRARPATVPHQRPPCPRAPTRDCKFPAPRLELMQFGIVRRRASEGLDARREPRGLGLLGQGGDRERGPGRRRRG